MKTLESNYLLHDERTSESTPAFPVYRGELPARLNPLNPRHYLLLAYWIFCRPTALKYYLYRAAPEVYRNPRSGWDNLWGMLRIPAYHFPVLMAPVLSAMLTVIVTLLVGWMPGAPVDWLRFAFGAALFAALISAVFGVASCVAFGAAAGVAHGVVGGVASGVAVGMTGVAFDVAGSIAAGVAGGMAAGVAFRAASGVASGVVRSLLIGLTILGALNAVRYLDAVVYAAGIVAFGAGALRLPFYLVYLLLALFSRAERRHPLSWDELHVLPPPGAEAFLLQQLQRNEREGLDLLADVTRNPFQRRVVRSVLRRYLHDHPQPLRFLFRLLNTPSLHMFVVVPLQKGDWENVRSARQALLAELGKSSPDNPQTPLIRFAGLLFWLLEQREAIENDAAPFDLAQWREVYLGVQDYPGGAEIVHVFTWMERFLAYHRIVDLTEADASATLPPVAERIRPAVGVALARLDAVGREIAVSMTITNDADQRAVLLRAADALTELDRYVTNDVPPPERYLLRRIIRQWQELISPGTAT